MRLLLSHGWIGGLFGRLDRALLTLAASTTIPYGSYPGSPSLSCTSTAASPPSPTSTAPCMS